MKVYEIPSVRLIGFYGKISKKFRMSHLKLCGNCAFPQNFHTREVGEITVFFTVRNFLIFRMKLGYDVTLKVTMSRILLAFHGFIAI